MNFLNAPAILVRKYLRMRLKPMVKVLRQGQGVKLLTATIGKLEKDCFVTTFLMNQNSIMSFSRIAIEGYDGRMKKSFTAIQKCTSTIRQLATGNPPDEYDEYLEMAQRTSRECLQVFCDAIVETYEQEYLRRPTTHDILRLYEAHEERHHMPDMLGSLDCTHFNNINVLQQSPLFLPERMGTTPNCPFIVNDHTYRRGYYLVDDIYLTWSTFVKAYKYPTDPKEKKFKRLQEYVERAFNVLK
uniref:uncharacterized protein LOC122597090 n=1 Tax=Erigeron canadensis TaxID=72917 RepID=UPI001CB8CF45|nr:uncharacterized protein LOC122597090 [Erigeron canadensis]